MRVVLMVSSTMLWGDGECVSYRVRVLEALMSPSLEDDQVGVVCSVAWVCDVMLVWYGLSHDSLPLLSIWQLPQRQQVRTL